MHHFNLTSPSISHENKPNQLHHNNNSCSKADQHHQSIHHTNTATMADFSKLPPKATLTPKPFTAHVSNEKLQHMKDLLKLSPIGPAVFENTNTDRKFGMRRDWLTHAKDHWLNTFDWRQHEARFNSYPQFTADVKDAEGNDTEIHFLALFSERPDAVPLAFFHGWPGSFVEFLDLLDILKKKYTPATLPYHIIVPSLPGYAYSSGPPLHTDYSVDLASSALHNLLVGLGFGDGYLAQGGDIGSFVSRILASKYDACKGMHLNMVAGRPPPNKDQLPITDEEKAGLAKGAEFFDTGFAYALEHGTRTGTIGLALSSSPLALLAWIGEKFLEWTDADPPLDKILEDVTLYWLTDTFPRCIYPYRGNAPREGETPKIARLSVFSGQNSEEEGASARRVPYVGKPSGYSFFPKELFPAPKEWAAQGMDLVAFGRHTSGGHFAVSDLIVPE